MSTIEIRKESDQPPYRTGVHDSLQYHFFCGDKLYAARLFVTDTLEHASVWMCDGEAKELLNSDEPIVQSRADFPDIRTEQLTMRAEADQGAITFSGGELEIHFRTRRSIAWNEPVGTVIHQPDLECTVSHQGNEMSGVGYCKRYIWKSGHPNYWGYRFFHGTNAAQDRFVWTADATFGHKKYAYFNLTGLDGDIALADPNLSCHRDNGAYAMVDGKRCSLEVDELGAWETILKSSGMESQMRQRYCRMRLDDGNAVVEGVALNETCFGTLG